MNVIIHEYCKRYQYADWRKFGHWSKGIIVVNTADWFEWILALQAEPYSDQNFLVHHVLFWVSIFWKWLFFLEVNFIRVQIPAFLIEFISSRAASLHLSASGRLIGFRNDDGSLCISEMACKAKEKKFLSWVNLTLDTLNSVLTHLWCYT